MIAPVGIFQEEIGEAGVAFALDRLVESIGPLIGCTFDIDKSAIGRLTEPGSTRLHDGTTTVCGAATVAMVAVI
jgi:hypothetical protein